jgi:hypothetical protein
MTDASMTQLASMNDLEPSDAGHRHARRGTAATRRWQSVMTDTTSTSSVFPRSAAGKGQ